MTVLIKILTELGILLLAVVAVLLWVILVPRHFWIEYSKRDGLIAKMNIAFFKITLYPLPKFLTKKKKSDSDKEEKAKRQQKPAEEKKKGPGPLENIQFSFDLIQQIISAARGVMARVFKAIKFKDVSFTIPVYAGRPERTQQAYGLVTNSFYGLTVFLQKHLLITFKSPLFIADFANTYGDAVYFYTQVTASPAMLLMAAYYAYTQYKEITTNNPKPAAAEEKKENTNG